MNLWHRVRVFAFRSGMKRADYLRKHRIFAHIGRRVMITNRKIPLYPNLITLGDNVWLASGVTFVTHDVIHHMLNKPGEKVFEEKIGPITVGSDVFIGAGSTILYNVTIGNRVVVAGGSLVTRSVPDGSVVAGVPARVIGTFDDLKAKRLEESRTMRRLYEEHNLAPHTNGLVRDDEAALLSR